MEIRQATAIVYAARKNRELHPQGGFDNAGRFYPDAVENSDGYSCGLRPPSRSWPYSLMTSARTRKHIVGLAVHAPSFVLAEAAKVASTTKVAHTVVASIGNAIEKARRAHEEAEAERALLVRKREDAAAAAQRVLDESAADEQHERDMAADGEFLANLAA